MTNQFSLYSEARERIAARKAQVMAVGLGYVGLPLALTIHESGFPTLGLDLDAERVEAINAGAQVISYFQADRIKTAVASGTFAATGDPARIADMDVILICVPTPLGSDRGPDLSFVERAVCTIADHLRPGQLIILESTVWPGGTANVVQPILYQRP